VYQARNVSAFRSALTAFDRLLADFKLVDRDDPAVTMLARLVIEIVRTGERNPERIRQEVLGRRRQSS
jgi:hypothetical protein